MSYLGMASAALSAAGTMYSNYQAKKRQKEQVKSQKELNRQQHQSQLSMWKETNFGEQKKEIEKAGLNPALLYGMGGAGGATTGSLGAGSASQAETKSFDTVGAAQLGLMNAQKGLIEAQTEKTKVEAEKTSGVDTREKEVSTRRSEIDLKIAEEIGIEAYARRARIEQQSMNAQDAQKIREFDAWMKEAFAGDGNEINIDAYGSYSSSDNDLIRKVKQAGLKHVIEDLNNLKAQYEQTESQTLLNKMEAEIREFKVDLSKIGLNEQTAGILNAIIQGLFGMRIKSQTGKSITTVNK